MRAAVYYGPHDVRVESVPDPPEPSPGEVQLAVSRAAICGTDASEYAHGPLHVPLKAPHRVSGHRGPLVLGHEFAGRVVARGAGVTNLEIGARVACGAGISCGVCAWCRGGRTNLCDDYFTLGLQAPGGLAERVNAPAGICFELPDSCSDASAAIAQPVAVALHAVRRSGVDSSQTLAVIGVGGIGAFIVAAAAALGVRAIIAADLQAPRLATARALGAHSLIDACESEVATAILAVTEGQGADVVVEASGAPEAPAAALAAVRRGGRVLLVGLQPAPCALDLHSATLREVELVTTVAHVCDDDLPAALELLATNELASLTIDREIALTDVVDAGLRALLETRATGKIVVDPRR